MPERAKTVVWIFEQYELSRIEQFSELANHFASLRRSLRPTHVAPGLGTPLRFSSAAILRGDQPAGGRAYGYEAIVLPDGFLRAPSGFAHRRQPTTNQSGASPVALTSSPTGGVALLVGLAALAV